MLWAAASARRGEYNDPVDPSQEKLHIKPVDTLSMKPSSNDLPSAALPPMPAVGFLAEESGINGESDLRSCVLPMQSSKPIFVQIRAVFVYISILGTALIADAVAFQRWFSMG